MNILIDVGHPAHYHYFKNFALYCKNNGHSIYFVARDKGIIQELLTKDGWNFYNRGKGGNGFIGKVFYLIATDCKLFAFSRKNKIDLSIGFPSTYAAHASYLRGKPHFAFNDTEHASFERHLYPFFSKKIFTPFYFKRKLGKKHTPFNGFMEQAYLEKGSFVPNHEIVNKFVGNSPFAVLRFISWDASHDWGKSGLTREHKEMIINSIRESGRKLVLSSEAVEQFDGKDIIQIPSSEFHHFLYYADLVLSEGGTTSNEAALLGTPTILINQLLAPETKPGVHDVLEGENLQQGFAEIPENLEEIIIEMLDENYKITTKNRAESFLSDKKSPTQILIQIIKNYE